MVQALIRTGFNMSGHQIYEQLQKDIIDGEYLPSEKLVMAKLKKKLNTGQSPIREALSRLVTKGLVEFESNKGFRVTGISEANIVDLCTTLAKIEKLALEESIIHGDDSWEDNLVAAFHRLSIIETCSANFDFNRWLKSRFAFRTALIYGCRSPVLLQIQNELFFKIDRYIRIMVKYQDLVIFHDGHRLLLDATLKRDSKEACSRLQDIIMNPVMQIVRVLKEAKLFASE